MPYEFIALDEDDQDMVSYTTENMTSAHALLGALGLDYDESDTEGYGDEFYFTDGELSAAEAALAVAVNVPEGFTEGAIFLASVREELRRKEMKACSILIC